MNDFNIMALRGRINDIAHRVWLLIRLVDPLFYTVCALKTDMLSSSNIVQSLKTEPKKFYDGFRSRILTIFKAGVLF